MARFDDWPDRLQREVIRAKNIPYRLGSHDCFIWACACAKAMTGVDHYAAFGGQYTSKASALRAIQAFGGGGGAEAVDQLLGADRRRQLLTAKRGDWVLYKDDGGEHLGVCMGSRVMVLRPEGLGSVALRDCITAWEI